MRETTIRPPVTFPPPAGRRRSITCFILGDTSWGQHEIRCLPVFRELLRDSLREVFSAKEGDVGHFLPR